MADGYRITVRGEMSERFSRGFPGLVSRTAAGRTILEGAAQDGPPVERVLSKLDNLGLEVLGVEAPVANPNPKEG